MYKSRIMEYAGETGTNWQKVKIIEDNKETAKIKILETGEIKEVEWRFLWSIDKGE